MVMLKDHYFKSSESIRQFMGLILFLLLGAIWYGCMIARRRREGFNATHQRSNNASLPHSAIVPTGSLSSQIDAIVSGDTGIHKAMVCTPYSCVLQYPEEYGLLAKNCHLVVIAKADTDEDENNYRENLKSLGVDIPFHLFLFHSTSIGFIAIIRQLKPDLLITNYALFDLIRPILEHVSRVLLLGSSIQISASNVIQTIELKSLLGEHFPSQKS